MTETTCGPLYLDALNDFTGMDEKLIPVFAAGFVSGQCEKVYLGACAAAMFRPSKRWYGDLLAIAKRSVDRYGLRLNIFRTSSGTEIWVYATRLVGERLMTLMHAIGSNEEGSPDWHEIRGELCGVPASRIDLEFHERQGYGEPCDLEGA